MNETLKAAGNLGAELGAARAENARLLSLMRRVMKTVCQVRDMQDLDTEQGMATAEALQAQIDQLDAALSQQAEPVEPAPAIELGPHGSADRYFFEQGFEHGKRAAALSAVTAERDRLREDRDSQQRVCIAEMEKANQLRAEVETLRKDAERYRWASSGVHEAETLVSIVNCHGGYAEKVAERVDVYREAAMDAKEE